MFQCFVVHAITSKMFLKCFTLKPFVKVLQNIRKTFLQMFQRVEHMLKIGGGYKKY